MEYSEKYHKERPLEDKHFVEAIIWVNHFKPKKALDVGCGHGHRIYTLIENGVETFGFDLKEAIETSPYKQLKDKLKVGDILNIPFNEKFDFVIVYDVLEHLEEKNLNKALEELKRVCDKNILFSIPFINDPNLFLDNTHRIFKGKEWWLHEIGKYFKIKKTPGNFIYKDQMIIGEV